MKILQLFFSALNIVLLALAGYGIVHHMQTSACIKHHHYLSDGLAPYSESVEACK